jgi:predicted ATPase
MLDEHCIGLQYDSVALIGRQSELAALTAELDAVRGGHGRAFLLLGETGSGKW